MKNIKTSIVMLFVLISSTLFFVSCSNEDAKIDELSNKKIDTFLKSFYTTEYQIGNKTNVTIKNSNNLQQRTIQVENYSITEVFVGDSEKARGYIIENILTNEVESFIDVDRIEFKLTSVNFDNNQVKVQNNINQSPSYFLTDEFDMIKVITDPVYTNPGEPIYSTFGWREEPGACGNGFRGFYRAYFLFGIRWTSWEPVMEMGPNGVERPKTEPC